jgi:hypothetical protein
MRTIIKKIRIRNHNALFLVDGRKLPSSVSINEANNIMENNMDKYPTSESDKISTYVRSAKITEYATRYFRSVDLLIAIDAISGTETYNALRTQTDDSKPA